MAAMSPAGYRRMNTTAPEQPAMFRAFHTRMEVVPTAMEVVPSSSAWWAFDVDELVASKGEHDLSVSVCLPARNEAATIGEIVETIRARLMDAAGLVDELIVLDDGSTDGTAAIAAAAGARVVSVADVLPEEGQGCGKGNVIWRSLAASRGDLVCWIDADIRNFDAHFVTGLLGPLLTNSKIRFVKGHYRRPLDGEPSGGGRVSELMARPVLSRFFPELAVFAQPLAGEYGGRRDLLEALPIAEGWGVDIGLLIDAWREVGLAALAQVDLGVREHRNRPLHELGVPAMAVLNTVLDRAGVAPLQAETVPELFTFAGEAGVSGVEVPVIDRPPMRTRPGYRNRAV